MKHLKVNLPKEAVYYLASPYTHKSQFFVEGRAQKVLEAAALFTAHGYTVNSPIAYYHQMIPYLGDHGTAQQDFRDHNRRILERCDHFLLFMLDGWRDSDGITWEIGMCGKLELPITPIGIDYVTETLTIIH